MSSTQIKYPKQPFQSSSHLKSNPAIIIHPSPIQLILNHNHEPANNSNQPQPFIITTPSIQNHRTLLQSRNPAAPCAHCPEITASSRRHRRFLKPRHHRASPVDNPNPWPSTHHAGVIPPLPAPFRARAHNPATICPSATAFTAASFLHRRRRSKSPSQVPRSHRRSPHRRSCSVACAALSPCPAQSPSRRPSAAQPPVSPACSDGQKEGTRRRRRKN